MRVAVPLKRAFGAAAQQTRMTTRMAAQLWAAPVCPWAQRATIAVVETGAPFEYKTVDLHNKSEEFVSLYRRVVCDAGATAKVPVLVDGELSITESPVVAEYVLRKYGDDKGIVPTDPAVLARARLFAELFVSNVTAAQGAILKSDSQAKLAQATEQMAAALQVMDSFLLSQGSSEGGSYFLGGTYSIAEVLTTSLLHRAITYAKAYRGVDLWQLAQERGLTRMAAWMQAALERPSARQTMPDEAVLLEHGRKFTVPMKD